MSSIGVDPLAAGRRAVQQLRQRKFMWHDAVVACDKVNKDGLRVAGSLFKLYNPNIGYAWPTREGLAKRLHKSERSITRGLLSLKRCGAIEIVRVGDLVPFVRKQINRHDERGQVYRLNFEWARQALAEAEIEPDEADEFANVIPVDFR